MNSIEKLTMNSLEKEYIVQMLKLGILQGEDDTVFHKTINRCFDYLGMDEKTLAEMFTMSIPSARRWVNGTTTPHPAMRAHIYEKLIKWASDQVTVDT